MIDCPSELFEQLWNSKGEWFTPTTSEGSDFLYEALSADMNFSGMFQISIPPITEDALSDWELFESWLENIDPKVSLDDFNLEEENLWSDGAPKPVVLLGSENEISNKILDILRNNPDPVGLACVDIQANNRTLIMLYDNLDAWALGYGDTVLVVENLEELTEEMGFYS